MDPSKRTKCSVIVEPYSNGLAEDIAPKLLTTVLNAKGNMKMSQNSRSKDRAAMQAAFDATPKELGAAAVKAARSDLDEFFEKVGTDTSPNWRHTWKGSKTMDEEYGDGSNHICCERCGYCRSCGDCKTFGCGRTKPLSEVVKVSGSSRSCPPPPNGSHPKRYWND